MWETLLFVSSFVIIYFGIKMFGNLCSYTPWGCYYRGPKPIYVIVVTNNARKDELMSVFSRLSDDPISIVVVNDDDITSNFYNKTVNIVRALVDSKRRQYHVILLLETSVKYADKFRENFTNVQICEDVDAMMGDILDHDIEESC